MCSEAEYSKRKQPAIFAETDLLEGTWPSICTERKRLDKLFPLRLVYFNVPPELFAFKSIQHSCLCGDGFTNGEQAKLCALREYSSWDVCSVISLQQHTILAVLNLKKAAS
jgi:hypothetical protein